ncbi:MAG TPA: hypothetical protein PLZ74_01820 [Kiritimatiellia bacterium]|jgi:hypothetical protein|nr:hypothetical protein [Kiritimatiellia bacterium]
MKDATTNTITPRDEQEAKTLSVGARIATVIGIVGTAVSALLAAFGGLDWITAHLPLLLTGLGSLASGGIASYIAIRRMSIDKIAKGTGLIIIAVGLSGCVAICADSTGEGASVMAFGWGADSAAALSNVAVTGPSTNDSTGVSFDTANSQQKSAQAIQSLISLGAALAPVLAGGAPAALAPPSASQAAPANSGSVVAVDGDTDADPAGYNGTPGPSGEGIYGRPSCSRCQAYRAAHPDVAVINIDDASNRDDLWAALRLRGFTGANVSLPVLVTADGYTQAAR